jgi:roadblock/LC7 domain-containing protein
LASAGQFTSLEAFHTSISKPTAQNFEDFVAADNAFCRVLAVQYTARSHKHAWNATSQM